MDEAQRRFLRTEQQVDQLKAHAADNGKPVQLTQQQLFLLWVFAELGVYAALWQIEPDGPFAADMLKRLKDELGKALVLLDDEDGPPNPEETRTRFSKMAATCLSMVHEEITDLLEQ